MYKYTYCTFLLVFNGHKSKIIRFLFFKLDLRIYICITEPMFSFKIHKQIKYPSSTQISNINNLSLINLWINTIYYVTNQTSTFALVSLIDNCVFLHLVGENLQDLFFIFISFRQFLLQLFSHLEIFLPLLSSPPPLNWTWLPHFISWGNFRPFFNT